MKLVSREDWITFNKTIYEKKVTEVADHHYKTSYYGEKGNLVGFYESFPDARGEMVSIYFRTKTL